METFYITGFTSTGKTLIAKLLAARKELKVFDVKQEIEKKENSKIIDIYKTKGIEYIANLEKQLLKNDIEIGSIVALSNFSIKDNDVIKQIKMTGRVIYLRASASEIVKNVLSDADKNPLLYEGETIKTKNELLDIINKKLYEYEPYYNQLANFIIDIDGRNINDIFKEALAIYHMATKVKCHIYIK